jgi:hypothetical protein
LDFSRNASFSYQGEAFIARGDQARATGKVLSPVGFQVVRVDPRTGVSHVFAANRAEQGSASRIGGRGLERPITARFNNDGTALYIVDFGVLLEGEQGSLPQKNTGVLWRVTREAKP